MEGLFFYWAAWAAWVVITFFMNKGRNRTQAAVFLLAVIGFSNKFVTVGGWDINIALLIVLISAYVKLAAYGSSRLLYMILVCHMVALAYIGFTMYRLYDPIVLWFHPTWMMAVLIFLLVQILVKSFPSKCLATGVGIGHGHFIYVWMMSRITISAGSLALFDLFAACFLMLAVWHGYEQASQRMGLSFTRAIRNKGKDPLTPKEEPLSRTSQQ